MCTHHNTKYVLFAHSKALTNKILSKINVFLNFVEAGGKYLINRRYKFRTAEQDKNSKYLSAIFSVCTTMSYLIYID